MPLERNLLHACERILKAAGITYRKRHGTAYGTAGDPDLYFLYAGAHYEVELKRPGESPTRLQQARLHEWEVAGAKIAVIHSTSQLLELLSNFRPNPTQPP